MGRTDFFCVDPKKVPLFLCPKKAKKVPGKNGAVSRKAEHLVQNRRPNNWLPDEKSAFIAA
jgi:hypothetical protein